MSRSRMILMPNAQPTGLPRRNFLARILGVAMGGALFAQPRAARASTLAYEPFLGELALFGFNFAPVGWAQCNGQLLTISSNSALFALLGTTYGGNGVNTFALPDLRGRVPLGMGQGSGLTSRTLGETGGAESRALGVSEMPSHTHGVYVSNALGTADSPEGAFPARNPAGIPSFGATGTVLGGAGQIAWSGGGLPHGNVPPYQVLNWCIATQGIYPTRP